MELVNFVAAGLGVIGAVIGAMGWFAGAVKKTYAAEREFLHLRSTMNQGYQDIEKELSILSARLERIELLLLEIEIKMGVKLTASDRIPKDTIDR